MPPTPERGDDVNPSNDEIDAAILARRREIAKAASRAEMTKAAPTKAEVDAWMAKELKARESYEGHVCDACAKTGRHCATFCRPKSDRQKTVEVKSSGAAGDDALIDAMEAVLASAVEIARVVKKHKSQREAVGRRLSRKNVNLIRNAHEALAEVMAGARRLLAMPAPEPFDLDGVKAQIAESEALMRKAAETKNLIRRAIERRALYFDFSSN